MSAEQAQFQSRNPRSRGISGDDELMSHQEDAALNDLRYNESLEASTRDGSKIVNVSSSIGPHTTSVELQPNSKGYPAQSNCHTRKPEREDSLGSANMDESLDDDQRVQGRNQAAGSQEAAQAMLRASGHCSTEAKKATTDPCKLGSITLPHVFKHKQISYTDTSPISMPPIRVVDGFGLEMTNRHVSGVVYEKMKTGYYRRNHLVLREGELYVYRRPDDEQFYKMYVLSGIFVKEGDRVDVDEKQEVARLFPLEMLIGGKLGSVQLYFDTKQAADSWLLELERASGNFNIHKYYKIENEEKGLRGKHQTTELQEIQ